MRQPFAPTIGGNLLGSDEASVARRIFLGKLEDLFENCGDRTARPHVMFDMPHTVAKAALDVPFERAFLDRAPVAEAL
ncbi:hypothetical protein AWB74_08739 [Caballeronia arvi]|uniref:Uncharacterized protein n=1 Tax=Caballeronia arvi TaxID=1777135 RepID=A0A158L6X5_9BURK|nr:hypothetical protein AWB74_08739 [Caballeronia arvi]